MQSRGETAEPCRGGPSGARRSLLDLMGRRSRARRHRSPVWGSVKLEPTAGSHFLIGLRGHAAESVPIGELPGAHRLPGSGKWSVPALPAAVDPLLDLLGAHPALEVDDAAAYALEELDELPAGTVGTVTFAAYDRPGFVVTVHPLAPALLRALAGLPGATRDERLGRWLVPAGPGAAAGLLDLLERWPELHAEELVAEVLEALAASRGGRLGPSGERSTAPQPCEIRLGEGPDGEVVTVCANCADQRAGAELDAVPDVLYDGYELLIPAVPDAAPAVRALLDRADGLAVADGVAERIAQLEEARRRADEMVALSQARDTSFSVAGLGGTLRPFQRAGVEYVLRTRRTFLADEQGLGKTVQALAAVAAAGAYPALVVCPASLKLNWQREAERWLPGRSIQVVGRRSQGAVIDGADLTIINYEQLAPQEQALGELEARALVLDESHYCKNPKAKRTHAARRLAGSIGPDGLVLALTGTPLLNRPMELLPQLDLLGRLRELGGYGRFITTYARGVDLDHLHRQMRTTCFVRRRKHEVLTQLPAKQRTVVPVELDNRREYSQAEADVVAFLRERAALEQRFVASLEGLGPEERARRVRARQDDAAERALRAEPLVRLTALKRLAALGKLRAAVDWIRAFLESGEKLVVFAHHREVLEGLVAAFPDAGHVLGGDQIADRQAAVERFQADADCQLMLCSQQAGGFGLTLTAAANVAFLELGWNPAVHDQAEDRCHRIGQSRQVSAWYLLAAGTVDEPIAELIEHKRAVVAAAADGETMAERASVLGDLVETLVAEGASGRAETTQAA